MRYRLTCLIPTLVGDGRKLSPIDYMVWKDHVNVLDQWREVTHIAAGTGVFHDRHGGDPAQRRIGDAASLLVALLGDHECAADF